MPSINENKPNPEDTLAGQDPQFSLREPTEAEALAPLPQPGIFEQTDQLRAWTKSITDNALEEDPGELDVAALVKAQATFIRAQTRFMTTGAQDNPEVGYRKLTQYSMAQGAYIEALTAVLAQLGMV